MEHGIPIRKPIVGYGLGALTAAAMVLAAPFAQAAPTQQLCPGPAVTGVTGLITNGSSCQLVATGTTAVALFVGFSAGDNDDLTLPGATITQILPGPPPLVSGAIFNNYHSTPGDAYTLGNLTAGEDLLFTLTNNSTSPITSYVSGTAYTNTSAFHPVYHFADFTFTNAADFNSVFAPGGVGVPMTAAANTFILNNGGYAAYIFSGTEDLAAANLDDWNDLIFAFKNVTTTTVPEPGSLALLGAALVGFAVSRRRRAS